MAEVAQAEGNFITQKWGPVPVWVWALGGLVLAWAFAKYRDLKSAAAAATPAAAPGTTASAESQQVAPQFLIENNLPPEGPVNVTVPITGIPSTPVTPPVTPEPPVVTPPTTTPQPPTTNKPPPPPPKPGPKAPLEYKVVHGDTLSSIAARHHTTWQKLFTYNTTPGVRPAKTIQTLKQRGPNLLYAGETILIPQ